MKKLFNIVIASAAMLPLVSCGDSFLELTPDTAITAETFYKTTTHFEQAITAAYVPTRNIALDGMFMDEMRSDNTFYTLYAGDRGPYSTTEVLALFLDDELVSWMPDRYNSVYVGISRANTILDRMDASEMNEAEKTAYKAEALFLRAYYYFDLVQHWGGVPLMLHEVKNETDAFAAKSSKEEVYAQIITDVSEAINLGLPMATKFPQSGRATMGAAKMLRAYAYMSQPNKDYKAAEQDLLDITKMGYKLLDDYADVFDPANKNSQESIFEVQFLEDGSSDQYNTIPWRMIPKCSNNDFLMGIAGSNYAGTSGGWCVPTEEMIASYEPGDKRLDASVAVAVGTEDASQNFTCSEVKTVTDYQPVDGEAAHFFVRKYYHPPYQFSLRAGDNFPVYRYAGALLLLAENLVAQNRASEALPYVNQVRQRAGLPALTSVNEKAVADEMRHELAFENHRWTDLIRTGKAIETMNAFGETMKAKYGWILPGAFNVNENRLVYAFPMREMQINYLLEQNPGYSTGR